MLLAEKKNHLIVPSLSISASSSSPCAIGWMSPGMPLAEKKIIWLFPHYLYLLRQAVPVMLLVECLLECHWLRKKSSDCSLTIYICFVKQSLWCYWLNVSCNAIGWERSHLIVPSLSISASSSSPWPFLWCYWTSVSCNAIGWERSHLIVPSLSISVSSSSPWSFLWCYWLSVSCNAIGWERSHLIVPSLSISAESSRPWPFLWCYWSSVSCNAIGWEGSHLIVPPGHSCDAIGWVSPVMLLAEKEVTWSFPHCLYLLRQAVPGHSCNAIGWVSSVMLLAEKEVTWSFPHCQYLLRQAIPVSPHRSTSLPDS
jgi:hypothetical protein